MSHGVRICAEAKFDALAAMLREHIAHWKVDASHLEGISQKCVLDCISDLESITAWATGPEALASCNRVSLTLCEVCCPEGWPAEVARAFADDHEPTGSGTPWNLRGGAYGRARCHDKPGFVHVTLDAQ